MIRPFIKRSHERKWSSNSIDNRAARLRRSSSSLSSSAAPDVEFRRGSLNNLTVPSSEERRGSYPGYCSGSIIELLVRRESSTATKLPYGRYGFNKVVKKLRYGCVMKVICGMVLLLIVVLFSSIYRLVSKCMTHKWIC